MKSFIGKFRIQLLSIAAIALQAVSRMAARMAGNKSEIMPNYTLLEPGLYLGGCCSQPPPGTGAVLSVTPNRDAYSVDIFEWQPIASGSTPTIGWLRRQVEYIDKHRRGGRTVFVHCDAGIDRSAFVVIAYYMWRDHRSRDDAVEFVRKKRAVVRPNPVFIELLNEWGASLGKIASGSD